MLWQRLLFAFCTVACLSRAIDFTPLFCVLISLSFHPYLVLRTNSCTNLLAKKPSTLINYMTFLLFLPIFIEFMGLIVSLSLFALAFWPTQQHIMHNRQFTVEIYLLHVISTCLFRRFLVSFPSSNAISAPITLLHVPFNNVYVLLDIFYRVFFLWLLNLQLQIICSKHIYGFY